jgi:hypothetical protein
MVIKVTDGETRSFFCHFDRKPPHDLLRVYEYKIIFTPTMGTMANRTKAAVLAARTKIPETVSGT